MSNVYVISSRTNTHETVVFSNAEKVLKHLKMVYPECNEYVNAQGEAHYIPLSSYKNADFDFRLKKRNAIVIENKGHYIDVKRLGVN